MIVWQERPTLKEIQIPPTDSEISALHSLLHSNRGFFIDKETLLFLTRKETSAILHKPTSTNNSNTSILGDLITREQIREWGNLPTGYSAQQIGKDKPCISLLSIVEYMSKVKARENPDSKIKKEIEIGVFKEILPQISNWRERIRLKSIHALKGEI